MHVSRVFILLAFALLSACSMRSAIDAMTSPEDRALAQEMVANLREGDEAWLRERFRPDLWEQSGKQLAQVPAMYPDVPGETELISYNFRTNMSGAGTERSKSFTLVTHGGGRWTVTSFTMHSIGGPDQVVQWSVVPHSSAPPEFTTFQAVETAMPWIQAVLVIGVLAVIFLLVWLVRRSRRKHRPVPQGTGTP